MVLTTTQMQENMDQTRRRAKMVAQQDDKALHPTGRDHEEGAERYCRHHKVQRVCKGYLKKSVYTKRPTLRLSRRAVE